MATQTAMAALMALTILVSWGVLPLSPMISDDNGDDQLNNAAFLRAANATGLLGDANTRAAITEINP